MQKDQYYCLSLAYVERFCVKSIGSLEILLDVSYHTTVVEYIVLCSERILSLGLDTTKSSIQRLRGSTSALAQ